MLSSRKKKKSKRHKEEDDDEEKQEAEAEAEAVLVESAVGLEKEDLGMVKGKEKRQENS